MVHPLAGCRRAPEPHPSRTPQTESISTSASGALTAVWRQSTCHGHHLLDLPRELGVLPRNPLVLPLEIQLGVHDVFVLRLPGGLRLFLPLPLHQRRCGDHGVELASELLEATAEAVERLAKLLVLDPQLGVPASKVLVDLERGGADAQVQGLVHGRQALLFAEVPELLDLAAEAIVLGVEPRVLPGDGPPQVVLAEVCLGRRPVVG
mmetsp:Transcript_107989/g.287516  ORF Transcript_107989/g.287516 Transcript_107989/m.287516 type:complete len:207 (-) Transcript_107989:428-1048(-)